MTINRYGDKWSYEWETRWDAMGKHQHPGINHNQYCRNTIAGIQQHAKSHGLTLNSYEAMHTTPVDPGDPNSPTYGSMTGTCLAEAAWDASQQPTYLVSAGCLQAITRTAISGLSMADFNPPFSVFQAIVPDGLCVNYPTMLVARYDNGRLQDGTGVCTLTCYFQNKLQLDDPMPLAYAEPAALRYSWLDEVCSVLPVVEEMPARDVISGKEPDYTWEQKRMMHVALSLTLLATHSHDELFAPLLLNRDEERACDATPEELQTYVARAERLHKRKAWVVGKHLVCPTIRKGDRGDSPQTGRTLHYQHWRAGHFHRVRHGEGHAKIRVKWFRPTLIRPDLPLCPNKKRIYKVQPQVFEK